MLKEPGKPERPLTAEELEARPPLSVEELLLPLATAGASQMLGRAASAGTRIKRKRKSATEERRRRCLELAKEAHAARVADKRLNPTGRLPRLEDVQDDVGERLGLARRTVRRVIPGRFLKGEGLKFRKM
jgi:hypothetical protein